MIVPKLCFQFRNDSRFKLDRRRLEAAHLKYAVLIMAKYPDIRKHKGPTISISLSEAIEDATPMFYKEFMSKYAGNGSLFSCACGEIYILKFRSQLLLSWLLTITGY